MLELVSQNYWWPRLSRYIAKFVTGCDACNQTKTFPTQKVGKCHEPHWVVSHVTPVTLL